MQKTNIKASILIWATFLSLILSVTFISISTKINKNLNSNKSFSNQIKINNNIQNIINSGSINGNLSDQIIEKGLELIIEKSPYIINIGKNEIVKIKSNIINNTINISIKGSPIYYSGTTNTGIIVSNGSFITGNGYFYLKNLGGYSKTTISNSNITKKYTKYSIIKQIGNKKIINSKGSIKNF